MSNFPGTLLSVDGLEGLNTKCPANCLEDLIIGGGFAASNIDDLSVALFQCLGVGASDIRHINVVARVLAIAKYLGSFLCEDLLAKNGHHARVTLRTLAWTVHISIAKHNILQAVQQSVVEQIVLDCVFADA